MTYVVTRHSRNGRKDHSYEELAPAVRQARAMIGAKTSGETITLSNTKTGQVYMEGDIRGL